MVDTLYSRRSVASKEFRSLILCTKRLPYHTLMNFIISGISLMKNAVLVVLPRHVLDKKLIILLNNLVTNHSFGKAKWGASELFPIKSLPSFLLTWLHGFLDNPYWLNTVISLRQPVMSVTFATIVFRTITSNIEKLSSNFFQMWSDMLCSTTAIFSSWVSKTRYVFGFLINIISRMSLGSKVPPLPVVLTGCQHLRTAVKSVIKIWIWLYVFEISFHGNQTEKLRKNCNLIVWILRKYWMKKALNCKFVGKKPREFLNNGFWAGHIRGKWLPVVITVTVAKFLTETNKPLWKNKKQNRMSKTKMLSNLFSWEYSR